MTYHIELTNLFEIQSKNISNKINILNMEFNNFVNRFLTQMAQEFNNKDSNTLNNKLNTNSLRKMKEFHQNHSHILRDKSYSNNMVQIKHSDTKISNLQVIDIRSDNSNFDRDIDNLFNQYEVDKEYHQQNCFVKTEKKRRSYITTCKINSYEYLNQLIKNYDQNIKNNKLSINQKNQEQIIYKIIKNINQMPKSLNNKLVTFKLDKDKTSQSNKIQHFEEEKSEISSFNQINKNTKNEDVRIFIKEKILKNLEMTNFNLRKSNSLPIKDQEEEIDRRESLNPNSNNYLDGRNSIQSHQSTKNSIEIKKEKVMEARLELQAIKPVVKPSTVDFMRMNMLKKLNNKDESRQSIKSHINNKNQLINKISTHRYVDVKSQLKNKIIENLNLDKSTCKDSKIPIRSNSKEFKFEITQLSDFKDENSDKEDSNKEMCTELKSKNDELIVNGTNNELELQKKMEITSSNQRCNPIEESRSKYSNISSLKEQSINKIDKELKISSDQGGEGSLVKTISSVMRERKIVQDEDIKLLMQELNKQPQCLFIIDNAAMIVHYNKMVCEWLEQDKQELLETSLTDIMAVDNKQDIEQQLQAIMKRMVKEGLQADDLAELHQPFFGKALTVFNLRLRISPHNFANEADEQPNWYFIVYMDESTEDPDQHCSLDPNSNPQYIAWSLVIALSLLFLILQVPQDLAFGDEALEPFNLGSDIVITLIYVIDIVLNFFTAQEEPESEKLVWDNKLILYNYLRTSFFVDVVSTVPFDRVTNWIAFNTSIIKSIKIVKIFKFVKLFRVLKQISQIKTKSNQIEKEFGKEIQISLKRSTGLFELMLINLQILIGAHYFTIVYQIIKTELFEEGSDLWMEEQFGVANLTHFNQQMFLLSLNVKTALGLASLTPFSPGEIVIVMVWMFLGLSMFGQGIGNISSQLNNAIQDEMEQLNAISFFEKLCQTNGVEQKLYKDILSEIEDYFEHEDNYKFLKQGNILSHQTMHRLENAIYQEYIDSFAFLATMKTPVVRFFKKHSKPLKKIKKISQGSEITEIQFITQGNLLIQDDKMNLINDYSKNEVFGMSYFKTQMSLKQKIDIDEVYDKHHVSFEDYHKNNNIEDQLQKISEITSTLRSKANQFKSENLPTKHSSLNLTNNDVADDLIKICFNMTPVFSDDIDMFSLSFKILEDLLFNDLESFCKLLEEQLRQFKPVSLAERLQSNLAMNKFSTSPMPALLVLHSGEIQDMNDAALAFTEADMHRLVGVNIFDIVLKPRKAIKVDFFHEGLKLIIKLNDITLKITMNEVNDLMLVRGSDNKTSISYYNLKKSMLSMRSVQFNIEVID